MSVRSMLARARAAAAQEDGFSVLIALGVLTITALLVGAIWAAVSGDAHLTQHDLDAKKAYYAANAGINAYRYNLDQSPATYWQSCANDSQTTPQPVPGSTTGEYYSYRLIPANGNTSCISNNVSSLIDTTTGSFSIEFTGYSSKPGPQCTSYPTSWPAVATAPPCPVVRTVVASFRENSPFKFIWYTVYEALDSGLTQYYYGSSINCGVFYVNSRDSRCNINWTSHDTVNGPMHTEDQYLINGAPTFGRPGDRIESAQQNSICSGGNCGGLVIKGQAVPGASSINPPSDNSFLATDAGNYGKVFSGTTTITLNQNTATVTNCPSSCSTTSFSTSAYPVIYVANANGCTPTGYNSPIVQDNYPTTGCSGNVYVSGNYSSPLTIAAANDIIISNNLTSTTTDGSGNPQGSATLGLVANKFVRVKHGVTNCSSSGGGTNVAADTLTNPTLDAAVMAVQHSFIVDNYMCGAALSTLTVHGALAQYYRGAVGTFNQSGGNATGYGKNYTYDNRLAYLIPPYLFNISNSGWYPARQTLCTPSRTSNGTLTPGADVNSACVNPVP